MPLVHFKKKTVGRVIGEVYFVEVDPNEYEPLTFVNDRAQKNVSTGTRILTLEFGGDRDSKVEIKIVTPTESVTRTATILDGFNSIRTARTFDV